MYPGCVAFAHREGLLIERLGSLPNFESLVICTGGVVDTMEFDGRRKHFRYSARDENELMAAWAMVRHANHVGDTALLGQATTISARINEQLLPKPYFREVMEFTELGGADGVIVAHSGTALALILDPVRSDHSARMAEAMEFLASLRPPSWFHVSSRAISQNIALQVPRRRPAVFQS
jgi:L-threonine kinase